MDRQKQYETTKAVIRNVPQLVAISGSLRNGSLSTAILHALRKRLAAEFRVSVLSLAEVPAYNQDFDQDPVHPAVASLRKSVDESSGVIIATPEYNHGIPGVLKNALDWASRPAFNSCFKNKPVLILTVGEGALGGVRAQPQLRETLTSMLARVVPARDIVVSHAHRGMQNGTYVDENTLAFIHSAADALRGSIVKEVTGAF